MRTIKVSKAIPPHYDNRISTIMCTVHCPRCGLLGPIGAFEVDRALTGSMTCPDCGDYLGDESILTRQWIPAKRVVPPVTLLGFTLFKFKNKGRWSEPIT